ncbi:MAG TPA: hypothetical protein VIV60_32160, partial [Polyangiaceae bacterium]
MLTRTRLHGVRIIGAAVVSAIAASSCLRPAVVAIEPATQPKTTLLTQGIGAGVLSVGPACAATGLETCFNATDDNCNGVVDEGCGLAVGTLQLVIAWDPPDADVDLDVADPGGESARVGEATALGLVKDRDCPGEGDVCGGQNIEVVTCVTDTVPLGRYRVTLTLEKPPTNGEAVLVHVGGH